MHRDECNQAKFHPMKDAVSLAARPHCTAALLISRRGLHRLDRLLRPGFGEIGGVCPCAVLDAWPSCAGWAGLTRGDLTDLMMAEFCEEKLNCFKLRQPIFAQVLTRDELGRAMQCERLDSLGGWWGSRALASAQVPSADLLALTCAHVYRIATGDRHATGKAERESISSTCRTLCVASRWES